MNANSVISTTAAVVVMPIRLAGRIAGGVFDRIAGSDEAAEREDPQARTGPDPQRDRAPKALDDVAITRKVESVIFRQRGVQKGKIDVNTAEGVVWLRGEAKTPDLIKVLERKAREVPEVKGVENLLHLPKTPAPSRTDTPASQRKTRRSRRRQGARKVQAKKVSAEEPPEGAEPAPVDLARERQGRQEAPFGTEDVD